MKIDLTKRREYASKRQWQAPLASLPTSRHHVTSGRRCVFVPVGPLSRIHDWLRSQDIDGHQEAEEEGTRLLTARTIQISVWIYKF